MVDAIATFLKSHLLEANLEEIQAAMIDVEQTIQTID
jgi:hypothetical protein